MQRDRTACVSCVPVIVPGCGKANLLEGISPSLDIYKPHHPQLMPGKSIRGQGHLKVMETPQGLKVHTEEPHLVSLGGGRLSTSVTLLPLPPGRTRIGTTHASQPQDIVIQGTGVQSQHCYLVNHGGVVTLYPLALLCYVDGKQTTAPTQLTQGCMLCLGRSNYFRFNHPQEAKRLRDNLPTPNPLPVLGSSKQSQQATSPGINPLPFISASAAANESSSHRDTLEESEFIDKVSRFEFLTHSSGSTSPAVSSPRSPEVNSPISGSPNVSSGKSPPVIASGNKLPCAQAGWSSSNNSAVKSVKSPQGNSSVRNHSEASNKKRPISPATPDREHSSASPDEKKVNYSIELDVHCSEPNEKKSGYLNVHGSSDNHSPHGKRSQEGNKFSSPKLEDTSNPYACLYDNLSLPNASSKSGDHPCTASPVKLKVISSSSLPRQKCTEASKQQSSQPQSCLKKDNRTPTFLTSPPKAEDSSPQTKQVLKQSKSLGHKSKLSSNQAALTPAQLRNIGLDPSLSSSLADSPLKALLLSRSLSLDSTNLQTAAKPVSSVKSSGIPPIAEHPASDYQQLSKPELSQTTTSTESSPATTSPKAAQSKTFLTIDEGLRLSTTVPIKSSSVSTCSAVVTEPLPTSKPPVSRPLDSRRVNSSSSSDRDSGRDSQSDSSSRDSARLITRSASPKLRLILDRPKSNTLPTPRSPTSAPQTIETGSLHSPNRSIPPAQALSKLPPPVPPKSSNRGKPVPSDDNPWVVNLKETLKPSLDNFKGEKIFTKDVVTTNVVVPGFENASGSRPNSKKYEESAVVLSGTSSLPRTRKPEQREPETLNSGSSGYLSDSAVFGKVGRDKKKEAGSSVSEEVAKRCVPGNVVQSTGSASCELDKVVLSTDSDSDNESLYAEVADVCNISVSSRERSPSLESLDNISNDKFSSVTTSSDDQQESNNNIMALSSSSPRSPRSSHITLGTRGLTSSPAVSPTSPPETSPVFVHSLDNNANCESSLLAATDIDNELSLQIANLAAADQNMANLQVNGTSDSDSSSEVKSLCLDDISLDDLTESQRNLKDLHDRMREERKKEQEMAAQEQQRLEEILNMCAEYEQQIEREKIEKQEQTKSPTDMRKDLRNSMTKIKTNGSLGKLGSPSSTHKEMSFFENVKNRRNSSSSTSEEEESEHGTIKRRPMIDRSPPVQTPPAKKPDLTVLTDNNSDAFASSPNANLCSPKSILSQTVQPASPSGFLEQSSTSTYQSLKTSRENQRIAVAHMGSTNGYASHSLPSRRQNLVTDTSNGDVPGKSHPNSSVFLQSNTPVNSRAKVAAAGYENSPRSSVSESRSPASPCSPLSDAKSMVDSDVITYPQSPASVSDNPVPYSHFGDHDAQTSRLNTLGRQRQQALWRFTQIKQRVAEIETQQSEAIRELELERALLDGEQESVSLQLQDDEDRLRDLKERQANLDSTSIIDQHKGHMEEVRMKIEELEAQCDFTLSQLALVTTDRDKKMLDQQLQSQQDQLDLHKKTYDDLEFQQLELETGFEEEQDAMQRALIQEQKELLSNYQLAKDRLLEIDQQQRDMMTQAKSDIGALETERSCLLEQLRKEKQFIADNERQVGEISKKLELTSPAIIQYSPGQDNHFNFQGERSYPGGKTNEEYIEQMKADSFCITPPNGRKMSQTLIDIEKNRQAMLDKQGADIIEEEKRRIRELKQRAAVESQHQWETTSPQRQAQCISFLSVESEDSSNMSSGTPSDKETSLSSGDDHLAKLTEMMSHQGGGPAALMGSEASSALMELEQERKRRRDLEQKLQQEVAHRQELVEQEVKLRQKLKAQELRAIRNTHNNQAALNSFVTMSRVLKTDDKPTTTTHWLISC